MEIEDLQVVWKEQEVAPCLYVDSTALTSRLAESDRKFKRECNEFEIMSIVTFFVMSLLAAFEPFLRSKAYEFDNYIMTPVFLISSVFLYIRRSKRIKGVVEFDKSIMGIVDQSIFRIKSYSRWSKPLPYLWVAALSAGIIVRDIDNIAFGPLNLVIAAGLVAVVVMSILEERKLSRKLKDLETFQQKLKVRSP